MQVDIDYSLDVVSAVEQREIVRDKIKSGAGDVLSMLGTVSDATQMLLVAHCELIDAIAKASTIAEIKAAAANNTLAADAATLLADVAAGTTKMTYALKGKDAVLADIKLRSTAVVDVLTAP